MKKMLKVFIIVILVLFTQITLSSENTRPTSSSFMIVPDPQIQTQINRIVSAEPTAGHMEEMLGEMAKLKGMGTTEHLLQQLIYFRTNTMKTFNAGKITSKEMENKTNTAFYTLVTLLITPTDVSLEKLSSPSAQELIGAVVPYLGTEDPDLKKELYRMLEMVGLSVSVKQGDPKYSEYPADYAPFGLFVEKNKDNLPEPLIQYMYQKSPGEALAALTRVYTEDPKEKDAIIQAENTIREDFRNRYSGPVESSHAVSPQAKEALDQLSKYPQWWIQLYVATILTREPQFSSPQILERLQNTKHPLVLKTLEKTAGK